MSIFVTTRVPLTLDTNLGHPFYPCYDKVSIRISEFMHFIDIESTLNFDSTHQATNARRRRLLFWYYFTYKHRFTGALNCIPNVFLPVQTLATVS